MTEPVDSGWDDTDEERVPWTEDDETRLDGLIIEVSAMSRKADEAINRAALEDAWWKSKFNESKRLREENPRNSLTRTA